jgi:2,3-bisphosphoglycerate-independent phosphoglycerate mutase
MSDHSKTKYVLLVGDGMADYPLDELGGKTPLEMARTPHMDYIAACRVGRVKTIPEGMEPGSDTANLSLLGYDPEIYHTGRSPLEAASMGVALEPEDVAFRLNLVTLDWRPNDDIIMKSHSSGDISTSEGTKIVETLKEGLETPDITLYSGVAYRHLLVWNNGPEDALTIPPHNVLDQDMSLYLNNLSDDPIPGLIRRSWELLTDHPVNRRRRKQGLHEANSIWLWGQGKAPKIPPFEKKYGLTGSVVCAVDLIKGIGTYAGFNPIKVEGATGYLDTNYRGKAEAALEALQTRDFVLLHVEAPDEASHNGNSKEKIQAIEAFDEQVVGTVLKGLAHYGAYRIMVVSDHYTPIVEKTHTANPPPFAWAKKEELEANPPPESSFTEASALKSGLFFEDGHELMASFLSGD